MANFASDDLAFLESPHVARCWFLEISMPDASVRRFHNGVGRVDAGGHEWRGVTDPVGGQFVALDAVEDPRFGQAGVINITLGAPSLSFFQQIKAIARDIEGRSANLYWAAFDPETETIAIALNRLFPGKISAPRLARKAGGLRVVTITVESIWQAQNFPFGGRWSPAGQRRRFPGDKGLDFVGVPIAEQWA